MAAAGFQDRVTEEQAVWILKQAAHGQLRCVSIGFGTNGYPAPEDGYAILKDNRSVWLKPNGETRPA